ncbi:MAG: RNA polymerase sigma factor [Nitriliruptoraceae bacterium]
MAPRDPDVMTADLDDADLLATYADESKSSAAREHAFRKLVERHQHRLFRVCVRVLDSAADAEEAVQETFIRLARRASTFRGDSQVSTWLYRIAHNVATDRIRYEARRPSTAVDDLTLVSDDPDADDHIAASDTAEALRGAIAQLDEQSRRLLLLVAVDELSYEEAAAVTGLAVGTIKSRVSRARVRLGGLLRDAASEGDLPAGDRGPHTADPGGPARPRGPPDG